MENCPYCGTKFIKILLDERFCPNCGTIPLEDNSENSNSTEYIN